MHLKRIKKFFIVHQRHLQSPIIFLNKIIKNNQFLNEEIISFFSEFNFTREDDLIMEKVKNSKFRDLEDALQYYSAEDAGVTTIITNNYFDFEHSIIPVYHPLQYINEFLLNS